MVFSAIATRSTANVAGRLLVQQQKRFAGGHAKAKVEWTGIDKVVRGYFPEDHQLAGAVLGGYFTLISFFVIKSKLKGKAPEAAPTPVVAATAVSGGDLIPSLDSPDFEAFVSSEARLAKFLESEESLMKWVDTLGK